jgi:dipeptidyl-peptidase-4|tara:strand:+ start:11678 stop:13858 length:2181 start_codon:yes stop_codon:yes gene_type:complete
MASPQLTVQRIFSEPDLSGSAPTALRFSPDGRRISYLKNSSDNIEQLDLWTYRVDNGQASVLVESDSLRSDERILSDHEKAKRERQRITSSGIIEYYWSPVGDALIFPVDGNLFHYDLEAVGNPLRRLSDDSTFETDIQCSPQGKYVSFVRQQNIHVIEIGNDLAYRQLTFDGGDTVANGLAEFIAQEEMHRFNGYWWSPDDQRIAFIQTDESTVAVSQRYEIDADDFKVFDQRYPYTGTPNVKVKLAVASLPEGAIRWLDLGDSDDIYLARVDWLPDGRTLAVQIQSRDQQTLQLCFYDSSSGERQLVLTENSKTWINLHSDLRFLKSSARFIWASERSGFKHLYLYEQDGTLIQPLTSGDWPVSQVKAVDEKNGRLYFDGFQQSRAEKHLYSLSLQEPEHPPQQLTEEAGWHDVEISRDCSHYIDRYSSTVSPPRVSLYRIDGHHLDDLEPNSLRRGHPYFPYRKQHAEIRFDTLAAADGQRLHYRVTRPQPFDSHSSYPAIVLVYGGPGVQRVKNEWGTLWHQFLARQGYALFELDNRGATNQGKAFEDPLYGQLGRVEVEDQLVGVEYLRSLPWVDGNRLGVLGHSYGGYMTLMLMMKAGGAFSAGVAVAPVTDWRLYDTHYTERYLSRPDLNAEGYENSNVFAYIHQLQGELLIMHGMADDNVLFSNSTKLFKALQDGNRKFEMMTYPGSKHGLGGTTVSIHRYETITRFFHKWLQNGELT